MLRINSSPRRLCTGLTRRELIDVGRAGLFGLTLPQLLQIEATLAADKGDRSLPGFGTAKRCIVLFLYGSPSQLETYDMKPNAPVEIRGSMQPIASSLPGLDVCEHLPQTARVMDRTTVVRSVTHPYPIHGVAYAMTGVGQIDVAAELNPYDPRHHPYFGSAVEYLDSRRRQGVPDFPQNVALPFPFSSQRTDQPLRAGPYGAFLGNGFDPTWTDWIGSGTREVHKWRTGFDWRGMEPYVECDADTHFRLPGTHLQQGLSLDRLDRRHTLLQQFETARRRFDQSGAGRTLSRFQDMAFSMVGSPAVGRALDIRHEPAATRDLYGMTLFGQACLAGRRMLEAGTRLVSVFWDEYGLAGDAWDTHQEHFPRMKEQLLPGFDQAYAGLILDLEQRGMLDDTLVVCLSEHGRTPKINKASNGGRDHWARAYCAHFAGGGIARGNVVGRTDSHASDVVDRPVSPKDLLATMYHLLGIPPHTTLPDRNARPVPLVPHGSSVVPEMLA